MKRRDFLGGGFAGIFAGLFGWREAGRTKEEVLYLDIDTIDAYDEEERVMRIPCRRTEDNCLVQCGENELVEEKGNA